ncbi:MAG: hypothetical protein ACXACB_14045 [Promethearchaeota archaeon]
MSIRKLLCPLIILLLCSTVLSSINAQPFSVLSFHGVGITVELVFPEEAHPEDNIDHNVTINSQTNPEIEVFNLTIYGTINQTIQEIKSLFLSLDLDAPYTKRINVSLPKETLGKLYCTLYAKTDQDTDYFFTSFFTTQVNPITFSELLVAYESKLLELEISKSRYDSLFLEHSSLLGRHSTLEDDFESNVKTFNELLKNYTSLESNSTNIQGNFTILQNEFNSLNEVYDDLQVKIIDLERTIETSQNQLDTDRNLMIVFIIILVSLIGLIIYLRNKQKEPYVVIRKETVSMKPKK